MQSTEQCGLFVHDHVRHACLKPEKVKVQSAIEKHIPTVVTTVTIVTDRYDTTMKSFIFL